MGNAVQLTDANFGDVIAKAETPILVDFGPSGAVRAR